MFLFLFSQSAFPITFALSYFVVIASTPFFYSIRNEPNSKSTNTYSDLTYSKMHMLLSEGGHSECSCNLFCFMIIHKAALHCCKEEYILI